MSTDRPHGPGGLVVYHMPVILWASVAEFAETIGQPIPVVSEILNGKKEITAETAVAISQVFGTTPELWLNLQAAYRLHQRRSTAS